jgi:hypothetical protein
VALFPALGKMGAELVKREKLRSRLLFSTSALKEWERNGEKRKITYQAFVLDKG